MRVMTYNTLFGGIDASGNDRRKAQLEIIRAVDPDVLLLQEAKDYPTQGGLLLHATERALGMRGFLAEAQTGQHTVAFLKPHLQPISFEGDGVHFHHAAAILRFEAPQFDMPVTAISVHLCPHGPRIRLREASYLVGHADPDGFAMLAGDFNSVSPDDPEPEGLDTLPAHYRTRYVDEDGRADRSTLKLLAQAGWIDLGSLAEDRTPTVPGAGFENTEFVPFRSDYVMVTPPLARRFRSYGVMLGPLTDRASDHYPLLVEFGP